jgi:tRNA modification GTPase
VAVLTKADLGVGPAPSNRLSVSAWTGAGIPELQAHIRRSLEDRPQERAAVLSSTLARCQGSLTAASAALERALELVGQPGQDELIAIELRQGLAALGEICGAVYTDDLLDRIFSRFCIGK